jgi:mannose/cellobiose epimerase-like protein (N-acyl-D-glucosamine 2-epimerase family)
LRWRGTRDTRATKTARRLIDIGEKFGVRNGVAINALLDDFSVHDADARLWPQAERLKAGAIAARLFGEPFHWNVVVAAAAGLTRYFNTPVRGLWYNRLSPSGAFLEEPAPASSFYHILGAIMDEIRTAAAASNKAPRATLSWQHHRRPILLAIGLGMFNQLSGINAILYYLNDIFAAAGFLGDASPAA